jgi:hypothetical protein
MIRAAAPPFALTISALAIELSPHAATLLTVCADGTG